MATAAQTNNNINLFEPQIRKTRNELVDMTRQADELLARTRKLLDTVYSTMRSAQQYLSKQYLTDDDQKAAEALRQQLAEQDAQQPAASQQTAGVQSPVQTTQPVAAAPAPQATPQPLPQRAREFRRSVREEVRNLFAEPADPLLREELRNREQRLRMAGKNWSAFLFDAEVRHDTPYKRRQKETMAESWNMIRQAAQLPGKTINKAVKEVAMNTAVLPLIVAKKGGTAVFRWSGRQAGKFVGRLSEEEMASEGYQIKKFLNPRTSPVSRIASARKEDLKRFHDKQVVVRLATTRRAAKKKKDDIQNALQQMVVDGILRGIRDSIMRTIDNVVEGTKKAYRTARIATRTRIINSRPVQTAINTPTARNTAASLQQMRNSETYKAISTRAGRMIESAPEAVRSVGRNFVRVGSRVSETRLARWTGQAGEYVGTKAVQAAKATPGFVRKLPSRSWKLFKGGVERVPAAASGVTRGALAGGTAFVVLGAGTPAALAGAAVFATTAAVTYRASRLTTLDTKNLKTATFDWDPDAFKNGRVSADVQRQITERGNIYRGATRVFRALDAGFTYGSLGALAATLLGGNALLGAGAGFAIGAGGRYLIDRYVGRGVAGMLQGKAGFLAKLAALPSHSVLNQTLSNQWFIEEIRRVNSEYKGDFSRYLQENWTFGGGGGALGDIGVFTNYIGAAAYISSSNSLMSTVFRNSLGSGGRWAAWGSASRNVLSRFGLTTTPFQPGGLTLGNVGRALGNIVKAPFQALVSAPVSLVTNPLTIGMVAGTVIGSLLGAGLGAGPGALLGAAIGSTVGAIAGGVIAGALGIGTGGVGFALTTVVVTVTTTVGQLFGQFIGNLFDTAVNDVVESFTSRISGFFNSLMGILNLLRLMTQGISPENALSALMGLIALLQVIERNSEQGGENKAIEDTRSDEARIHGETRAGGFIRLEHYNIALLDTETESWTDERIMILMQALEQKPDAFTRQGEQVVLAIGREDALADDGFTLIYIQPEAFNLGYRPDYILGYAQQALLQ
ncbi:MAG: hypothetical protein TR69_WS6001000506 [candidate division WS6 bacterium OLB20]|uniref:Uncharacterized protein n=1 Tax=candidate division WS6 bacterium OLB20 TaxID=1617426 RepID=A0A136LXW6_9BACT|nr:MAG: hypothetical protein TR69_WS6001000506 [candidate division WS6 bacterium OLB20]